MAIGLVVSGVDLQRVYYVARTKYSEFGIRRLWLTFVERLKKDNKRRSKTLRHSEGLCFLEVY